MSRQNQEACIQQFRMKSNGDIKNKKNIVIPEDNTTQAPITQVLSLKLTEDIPALLHANRNHKTCFVAGEKQQKYYTVVKSEKNTLKCNCKGFEYACICSHSMTVAEGGSLVKEFLEQVKSNRREGNTFCCSNSLVGVVPKGQQQRRVRKYGSSTERKPS